MERRVNKNYRKYYGTHWIIALLIIPLVITQVSAQHENGCDSPCCHQFDFWLGEWEIKWQRTDGQIEKGTNSIKKALDGCVIIEYFNGKSKAGLKGMSLTTYDPNTGKWNQTWVDNEGNHIRYIGGLKNDKMILEREVTVEGQLIRQRMKYYNISTQAIDWDLETSVDNGKNWRLTWRIHYKRKS